LTECLQLEEVQLITGIKKTMKNKLVNLHDKLMLRKRAIIEHGQRPVEKHFTDRAFTASVAVELSGKRRSRADCLQFQRKETVFESGGNISITACLSLILISISG